MREANSKVSDADLLGELSAMVLKTQSMYRLGKPNLTILVVVTAILGFYLALIPGAPVPWLRVFFLVIGTALTSSGACAWNMMREADVDALMHRTRGRPIPSGQVNEMEAFGYVLLTSLLGLSFLYVFCGPLPTLLSLATTVLYVFVYTPSKAWGAVSIWIGAIPGAVPPVMGWATVRGEIGLAGLSLFLLLFTWQFPHFLALAYIFKEDYLRGGFCFLPKENTEKKTGLHIAIGTVAVLISSIFPFWLGLTGYVYLVGVLLIGGFFCFRGLQAAQELTRKTARNAFFGSIIYLPILLLLMTIDRLLV